MNTGDIVLVVTLLILSVIAVIGNILVILAVYTNRRLQTPANYLIVNLAISDFVQGALTYPLRCSEVLNTGDHSLVRCDVVISLTILFHSASNLNLSLIALDRFFAVGRPFAYANMKKRHHQIAIAISWITCIILAACPLVGWRREIKPENAGAVCRYNAILTENYIILYVFVVDVSPLVIILITYGYIFHTTRRQIRQIRAQEIAVKHSAVNKAFDFRRESDATWEVSRSGVEALEHCPDRNHSVANDSPSQAEKCSSADTHDNNNGDGNEAKESISAQELNNQRVSLSAIQADHLDSTNPEMDGTNTASTKTIENSQTTDDSSEVQPHKTKRRKVPLSTVRTRKATRIVLAIIGFFIVLCLPITIIDIIELSKSRVEIPPAVFTVALCMVCANTCVNMFVYGGYNADYRKAYWRVLRRAKTAFLNIFTRTKNTICATNSQATNHQETS
ncbi:5-hydroxytryptamine receptor 1A-like [Dendronephthya gigantea]|uniref:5-hydroxytryptamine receptor 1A-like n=1 Tax=Dendronephthya gigantea TaxID=151771 RepID=UPI00106BBDBA|nr:5-hydroxytryptamine receptor 1A-like [Dendronephthya gigantea]XP_028393104.1 5-hydroxytryptamine receptor 1A-like [Dendronephthya gigantea]